jgi:hypothetical protein
LTLKYLYFTKVPLLFNKPNNYYKTLYTMGCGCKKKKKQETTNQTTTKTIQQEPNSPIIVKVEEAKKNS